MISSSKIIPPIEIIRSKFPLDLRVYLELCLLCSGSNSFELPKRETLAQICYCSTNSLSDALKRLSKTKYLNLINPGARKRRRVIVKVITFGEVVKVNELIEKPDIVFSHTLQKIHSSLKQTDINFNKLSDVSLSELSSISNCKNEDDLTRALMECENFNPKSGRIFSMHELFKSRFKKKDGVCTGELNPIRKNKSNRNYFKELNDLNKIKTQKESRAQVARIYPIKKFDIENIMLRLSGSSLVFLDEIPEYFRSLECFECSGDKIELRDNYKLVQIDKNHFDFIELK